MGLDMYLEGEKFFMHDNNQVEDGFRVKQKVIELGYWRKHPNLHGYIVSTFADGKDECQDIQLNEEAIQNIITAIKEKQLPDTIGFFFGVSDKSEEQQNEDIKIFTKALEWLKDRESNIWRSIVYRASW